MRQRLQLRLGLDLDNASLRNVSTIHALAYRILRAAKKRAGQPGWRVADENEAYDALRQAMAEAGIRRELYSPRELARRIEALRGLPSDAAAVADEGVLAVYRRYQQILAKARKWDLAELVPAALHALRRDDVLASLFRRLCQHLMVDEWQDVSVLEYEFLRELLDGVTSKKCEVRFEKSYRTLLYLSENEPERLYPEWDFFAGKLKDENSYVRYISIDILGNLVSVDARGRFRKVARRYLEIVQKDGLVTATAAARNLGKVLSAKRGMENRALGLLENLRETVPGRCQP